MSKPASQPRVGERQDEQKAPGTRYHVRQGALGLGGDSPKSDMEQRASGRPFCDVDRFKAFDTSIFVCFRHGRAGHAPPSLCLFRKS